MGRERPLNSTASKACCQDMKTKVINQDYYEDDEKVIVYGKNDETDEVYYFCLDKKNNDTLPLGQCPWCHAMVEP